MYGRNDPLNSVLMHFIQSCKKGLRPHSVETLVAAIQTPNLCNVESGQSQLGDHLRIPGALGLDVRVV